MKKANVILIMVCLFGAWFMSCVKENDRLGTDTRKTNGNSTAEVLKKWKVNSSNSSYEASYQLASHVGHDSADCSGKCSYYGGVRCHVSCQGFGNKCAFSAGINVVKNVPDNPENIYYTGTGFDEYEPSGDGTFNMPARSFYVEDKDFEKGYIWLNIPEQLLERNMQNNQFVYRNITFTLEALYDNR